MMKNKMDADDVSQEVLIKIWQNIDKFNFLSAKMWIIRTTHNLCIDYLRKQKSVRNYSYSIDDFSIEDESRRNTITDPSIIAHFSLMSKKIKEAVENLPEKLRSVFVLYEIQKFKYKEISKILDIPLNSVKVYLLRARKKLQEELKPYETQDV